MAWVRADYAGELAVLSAWLAALLPWSVTYASAAVPPFRGSFVLVRSGLVELGFVWNLPKITVEGGGRVRLMELLPLSGVPGVPLTRTFWASTPVYSAATVPDGLGTAGLAAGVLAGVAGLAILVGLGLSVAMYRDEERFVTARTVRGMGALLGTAGVAFLGSSLAYWRSPARGIPVPVGAVVLCALGAVLLTVDRVEVDAEAPAGA
jgi:hypothetical protein